MHCLELVRNPGLAHCCIKSLPQLEIPVYVTANMTEITTLLPANKSDHIYKEKQVIFSDLPCYVKRWGLCV